MTSHYMYANCVVDTFMYCHVLSTTAMCFVLYSSTTSLQLDAPATAPASVDIAARITICVTPATADRAARNDVNAAPEFTITIASTTTDTANSGDLPNANARELPTTKHVRATTELWRLSTTGLPHGHVTDTGRILQPAARRIVSVVSRQNSMQLFKHTMCM